LLFRLQILASPELRKQYDAHGSEGLDANLVNGALFFTCLFGSDRFEHLIGELLIAVAARSGGDLNMAEMKEAQVRIVETFDLSPGWGIAVHFAAIARSAQTLSVDCAHVSAHMACIAAGQAGGDAGGHADCAAAPVGGGRRAGLQGASPQQRLGSLSAAWLCNIRACFGCWNRSFQAGVVLTCGPWLPQEAMLVDTSYGSLLVGAVCNEALQLASGIGSAGVTTIFPCHTVLLLQVCGGLHMGGGRRAVQQYALVLLCSWARLGAHTRCRRTPI
jgi:hypothetical protein